MLKIPLFEISPLIESYYIEQIGNRKISIKEYRSINKSTKKLKKSITDPFKWVFIEYEEKRIPVILKKSLDHHVFLTGPLRLKKAKTDKDLEYWKKKLLDALRLEKSLDDILYPDGGVPEVAEELLLKARKYPIGTTRTWKGKDYKKISNDKWVEVSKKHNNIEKDIEKLATIEDVMDHFKKFHIEIPEKEKSELLKEMKESGIFDKVQNTDDLSNSEDYDNWFEINYQDYVDNLDKDVKKSVWKYITDGYKEIKDCLLTGNCSNDTLKDIKNIDKYIKDAPPMKTGIKLYRGESNKQYNNLNIGDVYNQDSFISFSFGMKITKRFLDKNNLIIKTISSKNTIPTPSIGFKEVILDRGILLIVSKKYEEDGYIIMEVKEK